MNYTNYTNDALQLAEKYKNLSRDPKNYEKYPSTYYGGCAVQNLLYDFQLYQAVLLDAKVNLYSLQNKLAEIKQVQSSSYNPNFYNPSIAREIEFYEGCIADYKNHVADVTAAVNILFETFMKF